MAVASIHLKIYAASTLTMTDIIPARLDPSMIIADRRRSLTRAITSMVLTSGDQQGVRAPTTFLRSNWGDDSRAALYLRAAVSPTATAQGYPSLPSYEVLPMLAPAAASMRLLRKGREISLEGVNSVLLAGIPFTGWPPTPVFVGEGMPAPVIFANSGQLRLGPVRKILIAAALTSELESASGDTAQRMISDAFSLATEQSMDFALFGSQADDGTTPQGLLHNVTPIVAGTGSTGAEAIAADIGDIAEAISNAGFNSDDMTIITTPRLAAVLKTLVGALFNYEIMSSKAIPSGTVIGIVTDALMYGYDGSAQVEVSRETSMHFESTAPLPIVGSPAVPAAPTLSGFQMDQIAVRVRAKACWLTQPGGIAFKQSVSW
jgi:hypothetical protein